MGQQHMTYVANATGRTIRVYYSPDRLTVSEINLVVKLNLGKTKDGMEGSVSSDMTTVLKRDDRIRYIRIPQDDYSKILAEGAALFVTVFVGQKDDSEWLNITENFYIPSDRSFIVTRKHNLKFQKYAANIWVDEDGKNHRR